MNDLNRAQLVEKVRKLMKLSTSPNENEAALALAKAQEWMDEYGLKMYEVEKEENEGPNGCVEDTFGEASPVAWKVIMFSRLATVYDTRPFTRSGTQVAIGLEADVECLHYFYQYLKTTIHKMANSEMRKHQYEGKRYMVDYRRSYCDGASNRVVDRVKDLRDQRLAANVACRDLIIRKENAVQNYMDTKGIKLNRGRGRRGYGRNQSAYERGVKAGNGIRLTEGITGEAPKAVTHTG